MRISNLVYMHTNELSDMKDILISADMTEDILKELNVDSDEDSSHLSVLVVNGEIADIVISDGYSPSETIQLTKEEKNLVSQFVEEQKLIKK